jgi:hypothetical protein
LNSTVCDPDLETCNELEGEEEECPLQGTYSFISAFCHDRVLFLTFTVLPLSAVSEATVVPDVKYETLVLPLGQYVPWQKCEQC